MTDEAPLPLSLIAHTAFCERRAWLEAQGERVENLNMERGEHDHQRVDTRKDERRATHRSVEVHSSTLGLTGRCDVVRSDSHGLTVVEYKAAPGRRSTNVTAAQRAQLALQGMCLEERGEQVADYAVYFTTPRREVAVDITAAAGTKLSTSSVARGTLSRTAQHPRPSVTTRDVAAARTTASVSPTNGVRNRARLPLHIASTPRILAGASCTSRSRAAEPL